MGINYQKQSQTHRKVAICIEDKNITTKAKENTQSLSLYRSELEQKPSDLIAEYKSSATYDNGVIHSLRARSQ
ncbi:hypothetical protein MTR_6g036593 [Medicago truncatula]|uniref:Uncharacterized protein n=1 Tax=Medicago truncatula TaxID=3880 RepID=A0A072U814_MEDTR|nr:hypothetical protein MTR_6g036593 [Medicago truncatula]